MKTRLSISSLYNETGLRPVFTVLAMIIIIAMSSSPSALSQVPKGFNYQAVARDASGDPITTPINVKIAILSSINPSDVVIWEELHSSITPDANGLFSIVVGQGTWQSGLANFGLIDWTVTPKYIRTTIDGTVMGRSPLWSVPYAMVADSLGGPVRKLKVSAAASTPDNEALFEVRNNLGKAVLSVYNDGVSVHVGSRTKGPKGGFSVGGFDDSKDVIGQKYFFADPKGVNVYIDDNNTSKDAKGGFSVGGFEAGKSGANFLDVSYDPSGLITTPVNRILWYPQKNAFLSGNIVILSTTDVGENSFSTGYQAKAKGNYSQSMGYLTRAIGNNSTAIGNEAEAGMANSYAFGDKASAAATGSYAIGSVGRDTATQVPLTQVTTATADYAFAIGLGAVASGITSTALGINSNSSGIASLALGAGAQAQGDKSTAMMAGQAIGDYSFASGYYSKADGKYGVAIGHGVSKFGIYNNAHGDYSLALGYSRANGISSNGIGTATVDGDYSTGIGHSVNISGDYAIGLGSVVDVSGDFASALGSYVTAESCLSLVVGRYNFTSTLYNKTSWVTTDPLFVVGNGTSSSARSNAFTILKSGNVGIGVTDPAYPLVINKASTAGYLTAIINTGNSETSNALMIGTGTTGTTTGAKFISFQRPEGKELLFTQIGSITQSGTGTSVSYNTTSDARIKTNIVGTHFGISDLMLIKVRDFKFIDDFSNQVSTGFVAQELNDVFPLAVTQPVDSKSLWQVDYGRITPLIVKAVQDQQAEIESLTRENQNLKADLEELRKEVELIKNMQSSGTLQVGIE